MDKETVRKEIREKKCIAIVRGVDSRQIVKLAEALYAGGITMMEVTFDQKSASDGYRNTLEGIYLLREQMEGKIRAGAGTVVTEEQLALAQKAGAEYIISPNVNTELIKKTEAMGLVSIPGALTPSEAVSAYEAGASFVKVFPAGSMGADYIKAIASPLSHIPFLAVGNIDENNVSDFIRAGACGVGIGGKLVNKQWIKEGNFEAIRRLASEITKKLA